MTFCRLIFRLFVWAKATLNLHIIQPPRFSKLHRITIFYTLAVACQESRWAKSNQPMICSHRAACSHMIIFRISCSHLIFFRISCSHLIISGFGFLLSSDNFQDFLLSSDIFRIWRRFHWREETHLTFHVASQNWAFVLNVRWWQRHPKHDVKLSHWSDKIRRGFNRW